ncbi:MAG: hypothetical protein FD126_1705 [Elusimicrobia bacterium]|nr:MAG: hypothetical protein FD126_1705 [Elusimicrobiota bacterium]
MFRPAPLPSDMPTLHFILAPSVHPTSLAAAALAPLPSLKASLPLPVIVQLSPAPQKGIAVALPLPLAGEGGVREFRLPIRAALEQAGAELSVAPQGGFAAANSLGALFEAGRKEAPAVQAPLLVIRRASDTALLDAALAEARKSKTGRRVLARAEKAMGGSPLPLQVRDLRGNLGEFDYMAGVLRLDRAHLESDPKQAAATLVHELVHVLQHREGVPAEALEMELEAHIFSMTVSRELGIPLGGFETAAAKALAKGPRAYADWMAGQLPGKVRLLDSDFKTAVEQLEMEVDDLENAPRVSAERLDWARSDLSLLKSRKGRAAYRALADRVLRLIKKAQTGYN